MPKKKEIPFEKIYELFQKGMYDREIAKVLGCCRSNISMRLKKAGLNKGHSKINDIDLRNRISLSLIGRHVGPNNPNFKGYTNEIQVARGICKTFSRRKMRECNFTCAFCGKYGGKLDMHHIVPFNIIMKQFLKYHYSGNISTIYSELMSYPPFIDESNLLILCKDCHKMIHREINNFWKTIMNYKHV